MFLFYYIFIIISVIYFLLLIKVICKIFNIYIVNNNYTLYRIRITTLVNVLFYIGTIYMYILKHFIIKCICQSNINYLIKLDINITK